MPPLGEVLVPCSVPRLSVGADWHVDALSAGGTRHRTADLVGGQESARSQPGGAAGHIYASRDALRLLVRPAQPASPSPADHVRATSSLLRDVAADGLPGWGRVGRHTTKRRRAREHGGRAAIFDA